LQKDRKELLKQSVRSSFVLGSALFGYYVYEFIYSLQYL